MLHRKYYFQFAFPLFLLPVLLAAAPPSSNATPILIGDFDSSDTLVFEILHVDDQVTVTLSNSNLSGTVVASRGYSNGLTSHDLTSLVEPGENIINIKVVNGPTGGWTIGWDLKFNDDIIASFSCGVWSVTGCNGNDQTRGLVYNESIALDIQSMPEPSPFSILCLGIIGMVLLTRSGAILPTLPRRNARRR